MVCHGVGAYCYFRENGRYGLRSVYCSTRYCEQGPHAGRNRLRAADFRLSSWGDGKLVIPMILASKDEASPHFPSKSMLQSHQILLEGWRHSSIKCGGADVGTAAWKCFFSTNPSLTSQSNGTSVVEQSHHLAQIRYRSYLKFLITVMTSVLRG